MRWYVDISSVGAASSAQRYCVEAEQWQKALQSVRAKRGDDGPFGNFSIELLDDGYRAIDPLSRTRFVVHKAPDSAELTDDPVSLEAAKSAGADSNSAKETGSKEVARARPSGRGARGSERGRPVRAQRSIPNDPVPRAAPSSPGAKKDAAAAKAPPPRPSSPTNAATQPASSSPASSSPASAGPVTPLVAAKPMQAATAFERMTGGSAVPLAPSTPPPAPAPAPTSEGLASNGEASKGEASKGEASTELLPHFTVLTRRSEDWTQASPLTYRESALAVAASASLKEAEAIARAQFEILRNAIASAPKGKFIQLAVFDHEFSGKPKRPPIVTLTFKDWRHVEPELMYPARDGMPSRPPPSSMPPRSMPPQSLPPTSPASVPPASAPASPEIAAAPTAPKVEADPPSEPIRPTPVIAVGEATAVVAQPPSPQPSSPQPSSPQPSSPQPAISQPSIPQQGPTVLERAPLPAAPAPVVDAGPPIVAVPVVAVSSDAPAVVAAPVVAVEAAPISSPAPAAPQDAAADVAPATVAPSTVAPSTVAPSTVAPSTVAPSTVPSAPPSEEDAPGKAASERVIPGPTPSEIRRSAADMAGDDERTWVKPNVPSSPPPPPAPAPHSDPPPAPTRSVPPPNHTQPLAAVPPPDAALPPHARRVLEAGPLPESAPTQVPASVAPPAGSIPPPGSLPPPARMPSVPPATSVSQPPARMPSVPPTTSVSQPPVSQAPVSAPPPSKVAPAGLFTKPAGGARKGGDDLITDLFEACSDLAFVADSLEAAEFVLDLVHSSIPSLVVLVSFFDINSREMLVVRQSIVASEEPLPSVVLSRASERTDLIARTMRTGRALVLKAPETDVVASDVRWRTLGVAPTSLISTPVLAGGRYLGLIEVANPVDGRPFTPGDGHALTYIGEQFGEYLSHHEPVLDPDRITRPKLAHLAASLGARRP